MTRGASRARYIMVTKRTMGPTPSATVYFCRVTCFYTGSNRAPRPATRPSGFQTNYSTIGLLVRLAVEGACTEAGDVR